MTVEVRDNSGVFLTITVIYMFNANAYCTRCNFTNNFASGSGSVVDVNRYFSEIPRKF